MRCSACGAGALDDDRFCPACGAKLTPACVKCGQELLKDDRFCPECGTPTALAPPPEGATPAPGPTPEAPQPDRPTERAKPKTKAKPRAATKKAEPEVARKRTRVAPSRPTAPATASPAARKRKPSRFWPSTPSNGVVLIVLMVLGFLMGLTMEDGEPLPGLFLMAMVFILFVIWRNILMGFGFFLTPKAPARRARARAHATPDAAEEEAEEAAERGAGGKGWSVLGVILVIAGLILAKSIGKLIGGLF